MPQQYPPYSVSRNSRDSHHSHHSNHNNHNHDERNATSPRRHTRNNPRPFASEQPNSGRWPALKGHMVAASGEFIGTTMFLFFAFGGTQVASMTRGSGPMTTQEVLFISLSFGFSLAVNAWAFYRISGGLFNPAVSRYKVPSALSNAEQHFNTGHLGLVCIWCRPLDSWSVLPLPSSDTRRTFWCSS